METAAIIALRQRVEDLKRTLESDRATVLRIVESIDNQGTDVNLQIAERLEEYFNTGE